MQTIKLPNLINQDDIRINHYIAECPENVIKIINDALSSRTFCTAVVKSTLSADDLVTSLRDSNLPLMECGDGDHSVVQDRGSTSDYSQRGGFFDLHQDGLGQKDVPELCLLFCEHPGDGVNPTVFSDTTYICECIKREKDKFTNACRLDFIYIDKSGREIARPLISVDTLSRTHMLNLGSRGYLKQRSQEGAPSFRDLTILSATIIELAERGTFLRHHWNRGDLVIWNNRKLIHGRSGEKRDPNRRLIRFCFAPKSAE